jgi:hypothetical protein
LRPHGDSQNDRRALPWYCRRLNTGVPAVDRLQEVAGVEHPGSRPHPLPFSVAVIPDAEDQLATIDAGRDLDTAVPLGRSEAVVHGIVHQCVQNQTGDGDIAYARRLDANRHLHAPLTARLEEGEKPEYIVGLDAQRQHHGLVWAQVEIVPLSPSQ